MRVSAKTIQILLTIIATILAIAALKATSAITIPLAFAFFIAVLVHPLQRWLNLTPLAEFGHCHASPGWRCRLSHRRTATECRNRGTEGIPMSLVVFSQEFKSTRAIALLFGDTDDPELKKKLK
jgi:hypothetical protein